MKHHYSNTGRESSSSSNDSSPMSAMSSSDDAFEAPNNQHSQNTVGLLETFNQILSSSNMEHHSSTSSPSPRTSNEDSKKISATTQTNPIEIPKKVCKKPSIGVVTPMGSILEDTKEEERSEAYQQVKVSKIAQFKEWRSREMFNKPSNYLIQDDDNKQQPDPPLTHSFLTTVDEPPKYVSDDTRCRRDYEDEERLEYKSARDAARQAAAPLPSQFSPRRLGNFNEPMPTATAATQQQTSLFSPRISTLIDAPQNKEAEDPNRNKPAAIKNMIQSIKANFQKMNKKSTNDDASSYYAPQSCKQQQDRVEITGFRLPDDSSRPVTIQDDEQTDRNNELDRKDSAGYVLMVSPSRSHHATYEDGSWQLPAPNEFDLELKSFRKESLRPTNHSLWTSQESEEEIPNVSSTTRRTSRRVADLCGSFESRVQESSSSSTTRRSQLAKKIADRKVVKKSETKRKSSEEDESGGEVKTARQQPVVSVESILTSTQPNIAETDSQPFVNDQELVTDDVQDDYQDLNETQHHEKVLDERDSSQQEQEEENDGTTEKEEDCAKSNSQSEEIILDYNQILEEALREFIRLNPTDPSLVYSDDLGEHDIEETRRTQQETIDHRDREYFEQWRARYFANVPIGQVVIDRLIRLLGQGYEIKPWFEFVEKLAEENVQPGCVPEAAGLILERCLDLFSTIRERNNQTSDTENSQKLSSSDENEQSILRTKPNLKTEKLSQIAADEQSKEWNELNVTRSLSDRFNPLKLDDDTSEESDKPLIFFTPDLPEFPLMTTRPLPHHNERPQLTQEQRNMIKHENNFKYQLTLHSPQLRTVDDYMCQALIWFEMAILVNAHELDLSRCLRGMLDTLNENVRHAITQPFRIVLVSSVAQSAIAAESVGLTSVWQCYWNPYACHQMYHRFHRHGLDWFASIFVIA